MKMNPPSSLISHFSFLFLALAFALPAAAVNVDYTLVLKDGKAYKSTNGGFNIGDEVTLDGLTYADGVWTMDNFSFATTYHRAVQVDTATKIKLVGDSTISASDANSNSNIGLYFKANTIVEGPGSLSVTAGITWRELGTSGISVNSTLTITNATVTAKAKASSCSSASSSSRSVGLNLYGTIKVYDSTVRFEGSEGLNPNHGIYASKNGDSIYVYGTGKVIAVSGGGAAVYSYYGKEPVALAKENKADGCPLGFSAVDKTYLLCGSQAAEVALYAPAGTGLIATQPLSIDHATVEVRTNGVLSAETSVPGEWYVWSNRAATVTYKADPGYGFAGGSDTLTLPVNTSKNPATVETPAAPQAMVVRSVSADGMTTNLYPSISEALTGAPQLATISLLANVTENVSFATGKTNTLDLAGWTLTGTGSGSVITIGSGAAVSLADTGFTGVITGGNAANGGAVNVAAGGAFTMTGGTITNCTASSLGGALYSNGAVTLKDGVMALNHANGGGAICFEGATSTVTIDNMIFTNNVVNGYGGAINFGNSGGSYVMRNCLVKGNSAAATGGAISVGGNAQVDVYDCTMVGNESTNGGAVHLNSHTGNRIGIYGVVLAGNTKGAAISDFNLERNGAVTVYGGVYGTNPSGVTNLAIADGYSSTLVGSQYVVGKNVAYDANSKLTAGTYTFNPTNAEYAAAGVVVDDTKEVVEQATTPKTWTIVSTYYVSANGNDSTGNGTVANPYKTIAKALDMVGANICTVCVMTDLVEPSFSKTFTGNVTITSDDGDPATVGEKFTVYPQTGGNRIWTFSTGTVSLENITLDGRVGGPTGTTKSVGSFYGDNSATLNLRNGLTVQNFRATGTGGGNIILEVQTYSTLNMEDGVLLTGNIIDEGRTAYSTNPNSIVGVGGASKLYIKGGKITGNTATGPATAMAYLGTNIKAYISGGEIFGNTMYASDSYALYKRMSSATAAIGSDYYFHGSPRVFDNYDTNGNQKNFHRPDGTNLHLDGVLTEDAKIGISSVATPTAGAVVADGESGYTVTDADANQLFDDRNTLKIIKHATNNQLVFGGAVESVSLTLNTLTTNSLAGTFGAAIGATANDITVFKDGVKMEGGYTVTVSGTSLTITFDPALPEKVTLGVAVSKNGYKVNNGEVAYIGLHKHCLCGAFGSAAHCAATHDETKLDWKPWTSTTALPTSAGNWYLVNDVTLTATYTPVDGVNLCLNGKVVKQTATASVMTKSSGTFTFTDCDAQGRGAFTGGKGTGTTGSQGGFVYLGGGTVNQYGGVLRGNSAGNCGGAVKIYAGTYNFYNGVMKDNVSASNGNAVQLDGTGTFNMYGGSIVSNRSSSAGWLMMGAIHIGRGTCNLLGGRITDNTGGGVSQFRSTNTVRLGGDIRITDNVNSNQECNLYLFNQTNPGLTVAVSTTTPLAAGAQIGVMTEAKPSTTTALVPVTSNRGEDFAHFTSDEGHLVVNEAGKVQLKFVLNVAFHANHADVTRDGAAFTSTNAVLSYGSTDGIPQLACGDLVFAGWAKSAGATTPDYRTAEEVSTMSTVPGSSHTLHAVWADKLVLGEFAPLTQTFPDAVATADLTYKQVTLMFTREMTGETFVLPTGTEYSNYTKNTSLSTDYSCVIDLGTAQTAAEIATNYLRQVKFRGCVNQELRVVLGPKTSYKTFYNIDTQHYYQYVPYLNPSEDRTWTGAYNRAKGMAYAGRQGYLVTVTTTNEDVFVYKASAGVVGWMGGTHLAHGAQEGQYYASFNTSGTANNWYWAGGPECGKMFFDRDKHSDTSTGRSNSEFVSNAAAGRYFNWDTNVPEPNGGANEHCLTTLSFGRGYVTEGLVGSSIYSWNDIPQANYDWGTTYAAQGFLVEYGNLPNGDTSEPDEGEVASGVRGYAIAVADIIAPYVEFNAWGGYHGDDPTCEVTSNVCVDGVYTFPRFAPTRAGEYTFDGWYASWTNGAAKAVKDNAMFVQGPHMLYAKWISPSTPAGQGEKVVAFEKVADGDGAILVGATNKLSNTDLAIPEFTKNGADGMPYVIIKEGAFTYQNYDRKRELELRAAGVPKALATSNRLSSVTISTYVTNIQAYAFSGCEGLTNVTFSKTRNYASGETAALRVNNWAFQNSPVKSIMFPANSKVILDYGAFADAEYLEHLYFLGDIELNAKYPFAGSGTRNGNGRVVTIHLSAKLASDAAFVAALTNGMSAARLDLDQNVIGAAFASCSAPTVGADTVTFTFKIDSSSDWTVVNEKTVYLFWSTNLDPNTFIGNPALKPRPGELTKNADGSWTAVFDKPPTSGSTATFFKLRIGAER